MLVEDLPMRLISRIFVRNHLSLRMTPAMAAGIETRLWEMSEIVKLIDDAERAPKPCGPYSKKNVASSS